MSMRLMKETIQLEHQTGVGHARANVEGGITLPGGLRETAHVLAQGASVFIERVEAMQDRAGISGRVTFHALYTQGAPDKIQAMEASADFSHVMELPGATAQSTCLVMAEVERVEAATSGGQMTLKAVVELDGRSLNSQSVEAVTGIADVNGLQIDTTELNVRRMVASGKEEVMLREEFDLPADLQVRETLFATALPEVREVTGGAGRAGVSGLVRLEVYHASERPEQPLVVTRHTIPFEQGVDLIGEPGETLSADVVLKDVAAASQGGTDEERTLRCEAVLGISVHADRTEKLTVLRDAYTVTGDDLTLSNTAIAYRADESTLHAAESGKLQLMLPEGIAPIRSVLCAYVSPKMTSQHQNGARFTAEGSMAVTLICMPAEGDAPLALNLIEPFSQTFAAQPGEEDALQLRVTDVDAMAITGDRVELRYVVHLDADGSRSASTTIVTDAAQKQAAPSDGCIVLYFVQPGETLWDIAKRYRVSEEEIHHLNPELGQEVQPGQGIVVWHRCTEELCK